MVLGIGAAQSSWGEVNTIKSGKISAIRSDVSDKQSIVYTSICIESAITDQYNYDKQLNDNCSSHTWNEDDDEFDQQLENGSCKFFSDKSEPVIRELRTYIEDWEKLLMNKNYQRTCTRFLAKYGGIYLYYVGFENRNSIDDDEIHFLKGYGYALFG